jgi:hypothetical protein
MRDSQQRTSHADPAHVEARRRSYPRRLTPPAPSPERRRAVVSAAENRSPQAHTPREPLRSREPAKAHQIDGTRPNGAWPRYRIEARAIAPGLARMSAPHRATRLCRAGSSRGCCRAIAIVSSGPDRASSAPLRCMERSRRARLQVDSDQDERSETREGTTSSPLVHPARVDHPSPPVPLVRRPTWSVATEAPRLGQYAPHNNRTADGTTTRCHAWLLRGRSEPRHYGDERMG